MQRVLVQRLHDDQTPACIGWDDLVTIHSAVVDQESDLVHVGDFLAYQSVSNEVIKLS